MIYQMQSNMCVEEIRFLYKIILGVGTISIMVSKKFRFVVSIQTQLCQLHDPKSQMIYQCRASNMCAEEI